MNFEIFNCGPEAKDSLYIEEFFVFLYISKNIQDIKEYFIQKFHGKNIYLTTLK